MKNLSLLKIADYNGKNNGQFYIQSHGYNAGKPLKYPIPNCFTVTSSNPLAFQIVYCLFQAKEFERLLQGSVIPFITIANTRNLLSNAMKLNFDGRQLEVIEISMQEASKSREAAELWTDYAKTYARKVYYDALQNA